MEFSCQKEDFLKGVQIAEKAVDIKSTLPVMGNILLETVEQGLKLAANNLEIGIEAIIPAIVKKPGKVLAPAKTLASIISKLTDNEIKLEVFDNNLVKISCGQAKFNIHGMPANEFIMLPRIIKGEEVVFKSGLFKEMIRQVIFSVSSDDSKQILNGIYFQFSEEKKEKIKLVATDGYRLALKESHLDKGVNTAANLIIPTKALGELASIIQADDEEIKVMYTQDQISFYYKNIYIITRILQGQFPDYKQVIPKTSTTTLMINRRQLLAAAERCAIIASTSANIIKIENHENKLMISAKSPDVGEVSELIDIELTGEKNVQVSFNVKLLIDALKILTEERISFNLSGTYNPGLIKPEGREDYIYIIMPIRTAENR